MSIFLAFISLFIGVIYKTKDNSDKNKKIAKILFIIAFIFLLIGINNCGSGMDFK